MKNSSFRESVFLITGLVLFLYLTIENPSKSNIRLEKNKIEEAAIIADNDGISDTVKIFNREN